MKAHTARPSYASEPPLARFLGVKPGPFGIVLSLVFVIVVGVVDHFLGAGGVSLAPFYVMPVVLATRSGGRAWGLGIAGLAAVSTRLADPLDVSNVLVHSWNALCCTRCHTTSRVRSPECSARCRRSAARRSSI
jgi:hypothetical protein